MRIFFLAALNVHLGSDKINSKNSLNELFHSLSMQALSKSDDTTVIKFDAINVLNKSLNSFLTADPVTFDTARIKRMTAIFDQPILAS